MKFLIYYSGERIHIDASASQCLTLPKEWVNRASSLDINGACVLLYDLPNCVGRVERISPFIKPHAASNLLFVYMNDVVSSIKLCY